MEFWTHSVFIFFFDWFNILRKFHRAYAFLFYWNITAMMLNQCSVAFNRFISVCYPVNNLITVGEKNTIYSSQFFHHLLYDWPFIDLKEIFLLCIWTTMILLFQFTPANNLFFIFMTWSVPFLVMLIPATETWGRLGFDPGTGTCTIIEDTKQWGSPRRRVDH